MTISSTLWLKDAQGEIIGATPEYIQHHINRTIRDFYVRSGSYGVAYSLNTYDTQRRYTVVPGANLDLLYIMRVQVNGDGKFVNPVNQRVYTTNRHYSCPYPGTVLLSFDPDTETNGLVVDCIVAPKACVQQLPSELGTHWYDVILKGSLASLMRVRNRPWSDMQTANLYQGTYKSGVVQARDAARRMYTNAETLWTFPVGWS